MLVRSGFGDFSGPSELALADSERSRTAGLALLEIIEQSPLATHSDLELIWAVNDNIALQRARLEFGSDVDRIEFVVDDEQTAHEAEEG